MIVECDIMCSTFFPVSPMIFFISHDLAPGTSALSHSQLRVRDEDPRLNPQTKHLPSTTHRILKYFQKSGMGPLYCPKASPEDDICMITGQNSEFMSINLDCPIGHDRMETPVIPVACLEQHLQCFDLE